MTDLDAPMSLYHLEAGSTIYVQDSGVQISHRLSKMMINSGPPVVFVIFRYFSHYIYKFTLARTDFESSSELSLSQEMLFWMVVLHHAKKVFEAMSVHDFEN